MPSTPEIVGPTSSNYVSQRLRLHYVDWGNEAAPPLVLVHGGKDHARNWDWVARELRADWHVVAPDLRGHGDSAWAIGGSYTIPEFVYDIRQLIDVLGAGPVTLVGHSFGGAISMQLAAVFPERVRRLVSVEGFGPPPEIIEGLFSKPLWEQTRKWSEQMHGLASRQPRRYPSIEAAAERMQKENPFLRADQAHHLTAHGVARNEDGTYSWKFDNYVRALYPRVWDVAQVQEMRARIACPTLLVRGTESWAGDPSSDGRMEAFPDVRLASIDGAGHWAHHDRFDDFMRVLRAFLAEDTP